MPVSLWVGIGIDYLQDIQSYTQNVPPTPGASIPYQDTLVHHGLAVPLSVGIQYQFTQALSIGPSFTYEPVLAIDGCRTALVTPSPEDGIHAYKSSACGESAANYGAWTVGLDGRFSIFRR